MKITSFAIFKNDKATGSQPQYRMVGKPEDAGTEEKSADLAGLWVKEHNGSKYYSGKMKGEFTKDDGTVLDGYVIIKESEYNTLLNAQNGSQLNVNTEDEESINPEDIPF